MAEGLGGWGGHGDAMRMGSWGLEECRFAMGRLRDRRELRNIDKIAKNNS